MSGANRREFPNLRNRMVCEALEERATPVVVSGLTPSLAGGTLPAAATSLQVTFDAPVLGGGTAGNFELRGIGTDGLLGTADDLIVPLGASHAANTTTLTFAALPTFGPENVWRLVVRPTITDTNAVPLDGDADGNPGGTFVRDFATVAAPVLSLVTPNGFAVDLQPAGFGAGQILNGTGDAFDGQNRLRVGGVNFAPVGPTIPAVGVQEVVSTTTAAISKTSFSDIPGLNATVSQPGLYRLSALLDIQNFGAGSALVGVRLAVNGATVEERAVTFEPGTGTAQNMLELERYVQLAAGDDVRVLASAFGSAGSPTFNSGGVPQTLRLARFNDIPLAGPSVALQQVATTTTAALDTVAFADVPGLTATAAATGQYRLSASVSVQNFTVGQAAIVPVRFLVNGVGGETRIISFGPSTNTFTESLTLEDFVSLNANDVVRVQAFVSGGTANFGGRDGALRLLKLNDVPNAGSPFAVEEVPSTSSAVVSDAAFTDVPGLSTTVGADGLYRLSASLTHQNATNANATQVLTRILVNGAPLTTLPLTFGPGTNTASASVNLEDFVSLQAGDAVSVQVRTNVPGAANLNGGSGAPHFLRLLRLDPLPNPTLADGGRTLVTPAQLFSGLVFTREVTVPATGTRDFVRTIEVVTNPSGNTVTTPVRIAGNLGSTPTVFATQSGNLGIEVADQWVGTDDGDGTGAPAVVHFIHGPSGLLPASVAVDGDNIVWTFNLTVAPGQTVRLASFTILGATRADAVASANALVGANGFGAAATAFLTPAELQTLANYTFPPPPPPPPNTPPTIGNVLDQSGPANAPIGPIPFAVGDAQTPAGALSVSAKTSNAALVPLSNIDFGGTGGNRTVTVIPANGQAGTATITITVADGVGATATDTFTVTVSPPPPANTPPDAKNDSTIADFQTAKTIVALANDSDGDGNAIVPVSVSDPANGSAAISGQQLVYTPDDGFSGTDTFTYTISDGKGGTDTATVTVTVGDEVPTSPLLVGYRQIAVGQDVGGGTLALFDPDASLRLSFVPLAGSGGVRTAAADFDGDGVADLVSGTGPGRSTQVLLQTGTGAGLLFRVDPFEASFTGGVYVAVGDVDGDGVPDIAITPDEGGGPRVDIYSGGKGFAKIASFFGIDDVNFRGGARAAIADLTGDGTGDLIVVAGFGGGPRVAAFDGTTLAKTPEKIFGDFFAFEQTLRNGVFVTAGDLNGDGFADLIAGGGPGGGPRVLAFDGKSLLTNQQVTLANFFGGDPNSRGGIRLAVKNLDGDNRADLVVGSGAGAGSRVTAYRGADIAPAGTPPSALDFDAFAGFTGGVFVG